MGGFTVAAAGPGRATCRRIRRPADLRVETLSESCGGRLRSLSKMSRTFAVERADTVHNVVPSTLLLARPLAATLRHPYPRDRMKEYRLASWPELPAHSDTQRQRPRTTCRNGT